MLARFVNEERTPPTALQVEPEPRLSRSMMTTSALGGIAFSANFASTISVVACREPDGDPVLAVGDQAPCVRGPAPERNRSISAPSISWRLVYGSSAQVAGWWWPPRA